MLLLTGVLFLLAGCASLTEIPVVDCAPDVIHTPLVKDEQEAREVIQSMPEIIGGLRALQQKIRYPEYARAVKAEGRVVVGFVVNKEGHVENAVVVKCRCSGVECAGSGLDKEALRVVRGARFRPGTKNGEPVSVRMELPITFGLRDWFK